MSKLERLRNSHRFKGVMTPEQQATQDHQAHTKWQENEYKAMQEGAEERANQPWRPENGMQLTSAYQHRAQHGFSGVLAGTLEEANCYWNNPNSPRDANEYWRIYYSLGEASSNRSETAQSGEASEDASDNDTGPSRENRQAIKSLLLSESYHRMRDSKNFANSIEDASEAEQCLNYLRSLKSNEFSSMNHATFSSRRNSLSAYIMTRWHIQ